MLSNLTEPSTREVDGLFLLGDRMVRFFPVFLLVFSASAFAIIIEKTFQPQTTIIKNAPSDALKITVKKPDFTALYATSLNTFRSVDMPFTVESINGTSLNYIIVLQTSQHYCQEEGQSATSLLGVSTTLNNMLFTVKSPGIEVHNSIKSDHIMHVEFPPIPQKAASQVCYGTFVVIAEEEM
ncbi:hypothetical protein [Vibrio sagamiensis]|uniref:Transmembrane protein n=1 Tax=Vibrio sagamiensis NBRC 104589 TaxID=1219064 RepID=A0A511QJX6_9VIBR|nr:hypothetical protein [Vibrio sagamiensis]PNQ65367.1 hypothetical protein C1141_09270 [Vibrio agarivorans]GEM77635.1 hypothetical protein VSA01S_37470 [Vibrio sagamiensis NBRC 104589]